MSDNPDLDFLEQFMEKRLGVNFDDPDYRLALRFLRENPKPFGFAEQTDLIEKHAKKILNPLRKADLKLILYNHALERLYETNEKLDAFRIYAADRINTAENEIRALREENQRLKADNHRSEI